MGLERSILRRGLPYMKRLRWTILGHADPVSGRRLSDVEILLKESVSHNIVRL